MIGIQNRPSTDNAFAGENGILGLICMVLLRMAIPKILLRNLRLNVLRLPLFAMDPEYGIRMHRSRRHEVPVTQGKLELL